MKRHVQGQLTSDQSETGKYDMHMCICIAEIMEIRSLFSFEKLKDK